MQSKAELIAVIYDAFNRREIDTVLATMAPQVDWPNAMEGTRVTGHAAVREYWLRQWTIIDPRVDPIHIKEEESGQVTVTVHQVVRDLSGTILVDQSVLHVYTFQAGLIAAMEIYAAPQL